ncbi:hypothetical protein O9993_16030 [Vibrio lentus]|nr:hypothetical protein [Vibrio lentus]
MPAEIGCLLPITSREKSEYLVAFGWAVYRVSDARKDAGVAALVSLGYSRLQPADLAVAKTSRGRSECSVTKLD